MYDRYEVNQTKCSIHSLGYAICLYYTGQSENARKLFTKFLTEMTEWDFSARSDYEIVMAVCHKLLDMKDDNSDFDMSEDDIIDTFCGM